MLTRAQLVERLAQEKPALRAKYGVTRIGLFGSFAADRPHASSDVDLLVEFATPMGFEFFAFIDELESRLGRRVEVLTPAGLEAIRVGAVRRRIEESLIDV